MSRLRCALAGAWAGISLAVGGCTATVPLVAHTDVRSIRALPVAMAPALRQLEDRAREGLRTLIVPTGQLLAYYFPGVSPGTRPRATLSLVDSRLEFTNSPISASGPLAAVGGFFYSSVVEGYRARYALTVDAVTPEGAHYRLVAHGQGEARMDGQAAIVAAVAQAAGDLSGQVEDIPPATGDRVAPVARSGTAPQRT